MRGVNENIIAVLDVVGTAIPGGAAARNGALQPQRLAVGCKSKVISHL
jgi:hypothetical protein